MNDIELLHKPVWRFIDDEWHMLIGNRSIVRLVSNFDPCRRFRWISVFDNLTHL